MKYIMLALVAIILIGSYNLYVIQHSQDPTETITLEQTALKYHDLYQYQHDSLRQLNKNYLDTLLKNGIFPRYLKRTDGAFDSSCKYKIKFDSCMLLLKQRKSI